MTYKRKIKHKTNTESSRLLPIRCIFFGVLLKVALLVTVVMCKTLLESEKCVKILTYNLKNYLEIITTFCRIN